MSGRARHSVRAADSNPFPERRARSDAPYPASLAAGGKRGGFGSAECCGRRPGRFSWLSAHESRL